MMQDTLLFLRHKSDGTINMIDETVEVNIYNSYP